MSDNYLGSWLVSEYVYNPDGSFAGIVRQRRELLQLSNGRIRVTQHCQPEVSLANHPMGEFTGTPVFELSVDGRYRRYHGPAVVGSGTSWGEGAMTGRGIWPDFGHNFRSFAILPTSECQLTGGKFSNATQMIANIAGVAVPEETTDGWPTLGQVYWPPVLNWQGTICTVLADGTVGEQQPLQRTYQLQPFKRIAWEDRYGEAEQLIIDMEMNSHYYRVHGSTQSAQNIQGFAKTFGPLLEIEIVSSSGVSVEMMELLDTEQQQIVGMRRWLRDDKLERVEVTRLEPQT